MDHSAHATMAHFLYATMSINSKCPKCVFITTHHEILTNSRNKDVDIVCEKCGYIRRIVLQKILTEEEV